MANRWWNSGNSARPYFGGAPKSLQMVTAAKKLKDACSLEESYDQPRQHIKKQRHCFVNKGPSSQGYGFSSSHVWIWELDYKGSWALKNWCFWTVVLEKTLESPLDCKEIQAVSSKENQSWKFIGRTDAEAEIPVLWPLNVKNWLIRKDLDARQDWGWEEKDMTEDEVVGWHHRLDGHEFEHAPGVGDGQGIPACCSPRGRKELDTTERLSWTDLCLPLFIRVINWSGESEDGRFTGRIRNEQGASSQFACMWDYRFICAC